MPPSPLTVADGLSRYRRDNGFSGDAMTSETIQLRMFGAVHDLPNPEFQRHLLAFHDIHHVLTGYRTDLRGEAEMGAWELAAGSGHWFVLVNNVGALLLGALCPVRTVRAFFRGLRCRSLYRDPRFGDARRYEELLATSIDDLRRHLRMSR